MIHDHLDHARATRRGTVGPAVAFPDGPKEAST